MRRAYGPCSGTGLFTASTVARAARSVPERRWQRVRVLGRRVGDDVLLASATLGFGAGARLLRASIGDAVRDRLARALAVHGAPAERRERLTQTTGATFRYSCA